MYFFGVDCFVLTNVVVITILSLAALFFSLTLFISALLSSALLWPVFREICEFVLIIPRHWLKTDRPVDQSQLAVTSLSSDWWRAGRGGGRWRRGTPVASDSAATDWVLRVFSVSSAGVESATVSQLYFSEKYFINYGTEIIWSSRQLGRTLVTIVKWLWETSDQVTGHETVCVRPVEKSFKILNFGELSGAPYSGSNNHSGGGGSDTESEHNVKSLMELQQQGMPGYGLYRSHYDNPNAGFGNGRHLGGYPFPPMPGQNYSGYPHLGYPSSQSPGPREGKYCCIPVKQFPSDQKY